MKTNICNRIQDILLPPYKGGLGWVFCLLLLFVVVGCDDYDSWTTSPAARLTFSADTVAFDTVITNQSSTTSTLIVFNHNKEGLRISRVALGMGSESPFRVNLDGQYLYGGVGEDFEVRRQDSIYARIEVRLPEVDSDSIHAYRDELLFTLESGVVQKVLLTASGMDVIILRGEVVTDDRTLDARRPYLIYDSLVVAQGATLTLPEGCTLMFHDGVSLLVHGTLKANGSLARPVTLRGDRTDRMFPYLPYDNTPNRWGGLHFFADSHGNELTQCDIHSGDYGIICDSTAIDESASPLLTMQDCVVHNIGGPGLVLTHCRTQVVGTQVSNTLGNTVQLLGGDHTFVHCTLAQFYPLSADRGDALVLGDSIPTGPDMKKDYDYVPLERALFLNCVITGYADDVLRGQFFRTTVAEGNFLFQNCLMRTVAEGDPRFQNVRYDLSDSLEVTGKDHFVLFDTHDFLYDFTPDSLSAIRGLADPEVARLYPIDRKGRSRLADGEPDAGAYEGQ
ncbi:MAG: hypothetical protein IJ197_07805 [Bacteroidaceae bacterium]|nr:hypothetical protein [Bacteroidaceae bacterium]